MGNPELSHHGVILGHPLVIFDHPGGILGHPGVTLDHPADGKAISRSHWKIGLRNDINVAIKISISDTCTCAEENNDILHAHIC